MRTLAERFPPLYRCEKCKKAVKVTPNGEGKEPTIKRSCKCPEDTIIEAPRKVTLRGKGDLNLMQKYTIKIKLDIRKFLSSLTGRSI